MTTIAFPDIAPSDEQWGLESGAAAFQSAFSGTFQTASRFTRWRGLMRFRLSGDDRAVMIAFLAAIRGMENRFTVRYRAAPQRGVLTGTPVVDGASQTGNTLNTTGWTIGQTNIIRAGDMLSFNNELHIVTADANSDGSGDAVLAIEPSIRISPANLDAINIATPTGTFLIPEPQVSWTDEKVTGASQADQFFSEILFEFVEDLLVGT